MKDLYRNICEATRTACLALTVVFALACPALAQFTTARLTGRVLGPSGLGVANATVTVVNAGTAYTLTTKSGDAGEYLFPSLPVGTYQISATAPGFSSYTQSGVALATGQTVTVPIELKVGSVSQKVIVTANANMVTTDSPTLSQLIDQKDIVGLPLNNRYVQQLVFLIPGTANVTANYCAANCEGGVFPSEQYAKINGAGANGVSYQLDGADYNDTYINTNLPFPNPDAIQDFNVMTDNMSAIYGDAIGGVVNITLKSGTDTIHGDLFEFFQNSTFNSKNWFAQSVSPLNQNQFGGDIGGPVLKRRLFYFGSYQGTRFSSTNNGQGAFVPNAAERSGDFSDLLPGSPICEPYGTCIQLVNATTGAPYLGNQIPVSPIASYLLKGIPLPNGTQLGIPGPPGFPNDNLYYNGLPTVQNTNEYLAKVDYAFTHNDLSGHYFRQSYTQPVVLPPPTNYLKMQGNAETLVDNNISVVDLYTITPRVVLGSYYGYTKIDGHTYSSAPFTMADAGVNIAEPPNGGSGNNGGLNIGTDTFGLGSGVYGVWTRGDQSLREIATITKGNHVIQVGGEAVRLIQPMGNTFQQGGTFQFYNALTGYNMADFEVGAVSNFIQGGGLYLDFTGINWSVFVQDDWKANPRLTISMGLRWDPWIPSKDSLGRVACFQPGAAESVRYPNAPPGLIYGGKNHDPGCPNAAMFADYANYGPRIGFAYQMSADGRRSLRGGAGYYYEPPNSLIYQQIVGVPPFAPVITLNNVSLADPYGSAGVTNPFPEDFGPRNPGTDATFPSGAISFSQLQDPHLRLPMILSYNLTLEQGFRRNWLLRLAYLGNTAHRLYGTGDQESGLLQLNPAIYNPNETPLENANSTQQRRVYPNYGSIGFINSGVNSNYNALQITVERRFDNGFSLLSSFAWAKALDDYAPNKNTPFFTNSCTCGRAFDYGPSDDDLSKVFKINGDYQTPRVNLGRAASAILNGWEVSGIASWYPSGNPFTVMSGVDNSFSAIGADRANLINVSNIKHSLTRHRPHPGVIGQWFNPADFAPNAYGTFGTTGKNALRAPGFFNTDLAAIKNTKFERLSLQLRADLFNVTNHPNFGAPANVQNSPGFGQIGGTLGSGAYGGPSSYGTSQPRIMQFGVKASF
ncbi:MAG TPA: carboxypeptidase regulatory-like domain-containing protein [Terriglobales bacterium]|nr:carboxypeptidase regulatory-like domain-containing protein [Terriglobales bacterium]